MDGQNMRASPVVMQYVNREVKIAWPKALQTIDPILPLTSASPYSK
jgi:branched-chain amino acid transport system substrate-binding protein